MEDFSINITLLDKLYNNSNMSFNYDDYSDSTLKLIQDVGHWIIVCTGLPLTLVAIAAVYSLVRKNHVAPVYIINLLVSDVIQLCCLAAWRAGQWTYFTELLYIFGLMASVGFMICISLERYLMITQPLWFRFRRKIQISVVVCVVVWILPLVYVLLLNYSDETELEQIFAVFLLLPFPLFIFFLVGTSKALSAARSVPADEKRRIVAILVVVLLIYTLLFLPCIIWFLVEEARNNLILNLTSFMLVNISPLADLTLYIFIRKGVVDKILASWSCCKMLTNQQMSSMSNDTEA